MTGKALAAAAAAAVALLAAGSAQPRPDVPAKGPSLLGIVSNYDAGTQSLVRVNPIKLRAAPGGRRIDVKNVSDWAFSPDKRTLAVARWKGNSYSFREAEAFLRLVDPYTLRVSSDIALGKGPVYESAWLSADRIVALTWSCCGDGYEVVVADPVAGRVVERRALELDPIRAVQSRDYLVVLAAPHRAIGPVRVLVIGADGAVRSATVDRIDGGTEPLLDGEKHVGVNDLRPALALAPDQTRAFVFSPRGLAAKIDLSSLPVEYHVLPRVASRIPAKRYTGASAWAQTLPDGRVALTGSSRRPYVDKDGKEHILHEPAGLQLVDTLSWSTQSIDSTADSFAFASDRLLTRDLLLATGSRWDSAQAAGAAPTGVSVYTLDGKRVFHLFKKRRAAVDFVYGNRAFVNIQSNILHVVNLGSGRVVGKRAYQTMPWLITP